jgi:hypothetical protein
MAVAWGAVFAPAYVVARRKPVHALWLAALLVSHWVLDWIAAWANHHRRTAGATP